MNAEATFRSAFLVLLVMLIAMRVYFAVRVRRAGGTLLPDRPAIEREGGPGYLAVRVMAFLFLIILLTLYILGNKWIEAASFSLPAWLRWTGLGIGIASLLFWTRSQAELDTQWSAQLKLTRSHRLVTSSPYAGIRHPLYMGMFAWCIALPLLTANWIFFAICALAVVGILQRVPKEEEMMIAAFGEEYRAYMRQTGRYFPRLRPDRPSSLPHLQGVARTLLVPLACRALESERTDAILHDPWAVDVYNALGADPSFLLGMGKADQFVTVMRARQFDKVARDFLKRNPGGLVVDLGCGMDTRFQRLDDGQVNWLGIDLPEVIELRRKYIPDGPRCRTAARSILDVSWLEQAAPPRTPAIFLAEGVFPYFSTAQVKPMILAMAERFPQGELVFDAASPFISRHHNRTSTVLKVSGTRLLWDARNPRELEAWGLCLLDQWYYFDEPEPRLGAFGWMRLIPFIAKSTGVFHFRLSG
ncbi:MAG TPA: class I SAM-dependent methyltransferase [Anaerolineales bacterium]